ncbi:hypothetical protein AAFX91_33940, partial [Bradyrhizobium sp. 31Argb]|uniref:hypothetical protein n=1 Tax=Bradyrhizobium sp. 31Argb TaxID=3141247 RepID=UPI003747C4A9
PSTRPAASSGGLLSLIIVSHDKGALHMIRKSGYRFSEEIMLKQDMEQDDISTKWHHAQGTPGVRRHQAASSAR